jgi:hypothetical protein
MTKSKLLLGAMALVFAGLALPVAASASTPSPLKDPRRAEVVERLAHQRARIDRAYRMGAISLRRAHVLHAEDHAIRKQERAYAANQGGMITRHQQRVLNAEENGVSRQIAK